MAVGKLDCQYTRHISTLFRLVVAVVALWLRGYYLRTVPISGESDENLRFWARVATLDIIYIYHERQWQRDTAYGDAE